MSLPDMDQPFVSDSVPTRAGNVPRTGSRLTRADYWGTIKARWNIGRMNYAVDPGLYAMGEPDDKTPVLVTANYKMSFDQLRKALPDRDAWILVLDTKGINVWCAAGKGTFGTEELIQRIKSGQLDKVVSHRQLILPQLAGPGVAAHQVRKLSGFKVLYGPVRTEDLPAFMDADLKATPEMRVKTFTTWERAVLIPVELVGAFKWALIILPVFFLPAIAGTQGNFRADAFNNGFFAVAALSGAIVAGTILTPLLLPWIPGRAFSLKGMIMGLVTTAIVAVFWLADTSVRTGTLEMLAMFLAAPAAAAYLGMNFTGSSTYTSLSGVKKEMKWAVPLEITAGIAGLCLWLGSRFIAIS